MPRGTLSTRQRAQENRTLCQTSPLHAERWGVQWEVKNKVLNVPHMKLVMRRQHADLRTRHVAQWVWLRDDRGVWYRAWGAFAV